MSDAKRAKLASDIEAWCQARGVVLDECGCCSGRKIVWDRAAEDKDQLDGVFGLKEDWADGPVR